MLSKVYIYNFAIIKELNIDFSDGLNVLTGETGSGKSIIFEAISLCLGERADKDMIGESDSKSIVMITLDNVSRTVLKREIYKDGITKSYINDKKVTLLELKEFTKSRISLHGQYDNQILINKDEHISILDLFAGSEILDVKNNVESDYKKYTSIKKRLYDLKYGEKNSEREIEFLKFEVNEIESLKIKSGEDEILKEEIKMLNNSEKIMESFTKISDALNAEQNINTLLSIISKEINNLSDLVPELTEYTEVIENLENVLSDINNIIEKKRNTFDYGEANIDDKIYRLDKIEKLKKMYGGTVDGVLDFLEKSKQKILDLENISDTISKLEIEEKDAKDSLDKNAQSLTKLRKEFAKTLEQKIEKNLKDLYFEDAKFVIHFDERSDEECTINGNDVVEFLISANKGMPLRPLVKVASGGEISRIMLAIKEEITMTEIESVIFDEIDTGISGQAANVVGKKLKAISNAHQIILSSHLPQIAVYANSHYAVKKNKENGKTISDLVLLNEQEQIEEIARLLSGERITEKSKDAARELLKTPSIL